MGYLTDNYPSGPCGACGGTNTAEVSVTWEWVQPNHGEGYYQGPFVSASCSCGYSTQLGADLIDCFGGQRGYAVGIAGPQLEAARKAAGWAKQKTLELNR